MIRLVRNGIFPITKDSKGNKLANSPETGLAFPGTIQGEGKLAGIPSVFIRLSGCNLRCAWLLPDQSVSLCDTPYSSFETSGEEKWEIQDIADIIRQNSSKISHLVITGGEPMLQHQDLVELIHRLQDIKAFHISIETNGTIYSEEMASLVHLFSISPKLESSAPTPEKLEGSSFARFHNLAEGHLHRSNRTHEIQQMIDFCRNHPEKHDFQLKFVFTGVDEEVEVIKFLNRLNNWHPDDVLLMPLGRTEEELEQTSRLALEACIRNGFRFAPRLHIQVFGDKPGV